MIELKNGYGITYDGKSYTLFQYAIQESKNGNVTEVKKQICVFTGSKEIWTF